MCVCSHIVLQVAYYTYVGPLPLPHPNNKTLKFMFVRTHVRTYVRTYTCLICTRIHVCCDDYCAAQHKTSKYGHKPVPYHVVFMQVNSPDDLSALQLVPVVTGHVDPSIVPVVTGQVDPSIVSVVTGQVAPSIEPSLPVAIAALTTVDPPIESDNLECCYCGLDIIENLITYEREIVWYLGGRIGICPFPGGRGAPPSPSDAHADAPYGHTDHTASPQLAIPPDSSDAGPITCGYVTDDIGLVCDDDAHSTSDDDSTPVLCGSDSEDDAQHHVTDSDSDGDGPHQLTDSDSDDEYLKYVPPYALLSTPPLASPSIPLPDTDALLGAAAAPHMVDPLSIAEPATAALPGCVEFPAVVTAPSSLPLIAAASPAAQAVHSVPREPGICPVVTQLVELAAELRKPSENIGPSAFLLFCLLYEVRINVWAGDKCLDIVGVYAPWAAHLCLSKSTIDAIHCAFSVHPDTGVSTIRPASDDVPISALNHYVASMSLPFTIPAESLTFTNNESFYMALGQIPLPTVQDGRCGIDVLLQSRGLPRTDDQFQLMRDRLSAYLLTNSSNPALIKSLIDLGDITPDPIHAVTSAAVPMVMGPADIPDDAVPMVMGHASSTVAIRDHSQAELDALRWACGCQLTDPDFRETRSLIQELPDCIIEFQVAAYAAHNAKALPAALSLLLPCAPGRGVKRRYNSGRLRTRLDEAKRFIAYLNTRGIDPHKKWPNGIVVKYMGQTDETRKLLEHRCSTTARGKVVQSLTPFYRMR